MVCARVGYSAWVGSDGKSSSIFTRQTMYMRHYDVRKSASLMRKNHVGLVRGGGEACNITRAVQRAALHACWSPGLRRKGGRFWVSQRASQREAGRRPRRLARGLIPQGSPRALNFRAAGRAKAPHPGALLQRLRAGRKREALSPQSSSRAAEVHLQRTLHTRRGLFLPPSKGSLPPEDTMPTKLQLGLTATTGPGARSGTGPGSTAPKRNPHWNQPASPSMTCRERGPALRVRKHSSRPPRRRKPNRGSAARVETRPCRRGGRRFCPPG